VEKKVGEKWEEKSERDRRRENCPSGRDKTEPNRKNKRKHISGAFVFRLFFHFGIPSIHFVLFLLLLLFLFNWLVSQSRQQNVHKIGCVVEKKAKKIGGGGV